MRSGYKRLGNYIKEVKERNVNGSVALLLGINIDKFFMPSVANVVGTDMSTYKLVKKGQFACNRMHVGRDYRLPIALSRHEEPFLVSPAYDVFEIIDTRVLDSEYLMMWFSRKEFDRNAWFYTDADVRGGLAWKSFCDMQLPVPDIDVQREIVREYNVVVNRIKLNEQLCTKLEETAQAIYKQWFVDFEFPDENGKPYKSSGGEMEFCKELEMEVPKGWEYKKLEELTDRVCVAFVGSVYNDYCDKEHGVPMLRTTNVTASGLSLTDLKYVTTTFHKRNRKSQLTRGDILVARHGDNGKPAIFDEDFEANALNVIIIRPNQKIVGSELLYRFLTSEATKGILGSSTGGSVQEVLNTQKIADLLFPIPMNVGIIQYLSELLKPIHSSLSARRKIRSNLQELFKSLLSKLATIEEHSMAYNNSINSNTNG